MIPDSRESNSYSQRIQDNNEYGFRGTWNLSPVPFPKRVGVPELSVGAGDGAGGDSGVAPLTPTPTAAACGNHPASELSRRLFATPAAAPGYRPSFLPSFSHLRSRLLINAVAIFRFTSCCNQILARSSCIGFVTGIIRSKHRTRSAIWSSCLPSGSGRTVRSGSYRGTRVRLPDDSPLHDVRDTERVRTAGLGVSERMIWCPTVRGTGGPMTRDSCRCPYPKQNAAYSLSCAAFIVPYTVCPVRHLKARSAGREKVRSGWGGGDGRGRSLPLRRGARRNAAVSPRHLILRPVCHGRRRQNAP